MKLDRSRTLYEEALDYLVEGVSSPSRGTSNYDLPIFLQSGQGAYVTDADGNTYVDLMMAYGAVLLGHSHPAIVRALQEAAPEGTLFAAASEFEIAAARLIQARVKSAERIRFANTGTEATMAALRLARGLTGQRRFIKFEGHYHGWYDDYLVSAHPHPYTDLGLPSDPVAIPESSGLPNESLQHAVLVPWNDLDRLEDALRRHRHELAAVITEPVMANMGVIPPKPGYLEGLQSLCRTYGILFILDETVTGFRLSLGGAAGRYGLEPDIITYGKALGAGLPVAALVGRDACLQGLRWGGVLHYGTQNASHIGMRVAFANLSELGAADGAAYRHLESMGARLEAGLTDIFSRLAPDAVVQRVGGMLQIFFSDGRPVTDYRDFCRYVDRARFRRFSHGMMQRGIYISPASALHSALSTAHTAVEIDRVLEAAEATLRENPS